MWRKPDPGQQALPVLVSLRKGETSAEVGAGFAVSTTTCWRFANETVELPASRAPKLRQALRTAKRQGLAYVVVDGTLIPKGFIDQRREAGVGEAVRQRGNGHWDFSCQCPLSGAGRVVYWCLTTWNGSAARWPLSQPNHASLSARCSGRR